MGRHVEGPRGGPKGGAIVSPEIAASRLVRAAVIELVRDALARSPGAAGATRELLRVADGAHLEGELVDVLRAALALVK